MVIRFRCPACNNKLSVEGDRAGERVPCPLCEVVIQIPSNESNSSNPAQQRRIEELEKANRKLEFKLAAAAKEAENLMATEMALWKAEAKAKDAESLEDSLVTERKRADAAEKKVKELEQASKQDRSATTDATSQLEKAKKETETLRQELKEQKETIQSLEAKIAEPPPPSPEQETTIEKQAARIADLESREQELLADLDARPDREAGEKLHQQVKQLTQENKELKSTCESLGKKAEDDEAKLKIELDQTSQQLATLQKDIIQFQTSAGTFEAENEKLVQNATEQRDKIKELVEQQNTTNRDLEAARNDINKLKTEKEDLASQLDDQHARDEEIQALKRQLAEVETIRDEQAASIQSITSDLAGVTSTRDKHSATIELQSKELDELRKTVETLQGESGQLKHDGEAKQSEIERLLAVETEHGELTTKFQELEKKHEAAVEESRMLLEEAARTNATIKTMEGEISAMKDELKSRVETLATRTSEIEGLNDKLAIFESKEEEFETAKKEHEDLKQLQPRIEEKDKKIEELQQTNNKAINTIDELRNDVNAERSKRQTAQEELDKLKAQVEADSAKMSRGEAKTLRRQLKDLNARAELDGEILGVLKDERDHLFAVLNQEERDAKGPLEVAKALREDRRSKSDKIDQLESRLNITLDEKADLKKELDTINHTLSGALDKLESFHRRAEEAEKKLADLINDRSSFDNRMNEVIDERMVHTQRIADLEELLNSEERGKFESENRELRNEISRMQNEFESETKRMVSLLDQVKHQGEFQDQLVKATRRISILENEIIDLQKDLEEKRMQLAEANLKLDMRD